MEYTKNRLGVVIGRFQVPRLHAGHTHIIEYASKSSDNLLILVGTTEAMPSKRNPLPYLMREQVLKESFPEANIFPLPDHPSDTEWSKSVDQLIKENFSNYDVTLFGSRDSFLPCYSGIFPVVIIPEISAPSGTEARIISLTEKVTDQFLSGMIYAQGMRFPIAYPTVDIAVIDYAKNKVLMGRKKGIDGNGYRFIGGFVSPNDQSLEAAAMRELREEAGNIDCHEITYIGSYQISDYRYKNEEDKILTSFFMTYKLSGREKAGDDIDEIAWIPLEECEKVVIESHKKLAAQLIKIIKNKKGE